MKSHEPAAKPTPSALLAVLDSAEELLLPSRSPNPDDLDHVPDAVTALGQVWDAVRAGVRGDAPRCECPHGDGDLLSLAVRAKDTEDRIRHDEGARRSVALSSVRTALSSFQDTRSVPSMIAAVPAAICTLGFDRAIFSRIYEAMWVTETLHIEGDDDWAQEILQAGREHPEPLTPQLHESEIVRRQRAILVHNAQEQPRVHRAVSETSKSRTYIAAPVMPKSQVIGFLHADRYFHPGPLTEFDRDLLSVFAEGFGYALERAILLDKLAQLREAITEHNDGFAGIVRESADQQQKLSRTRPTLPGPAAPDSTLTRREAEILGHMANGHTNGRIATKLVISEGTVKSHVKHILRKLGAANRAEAVSIWLTRRR